MSERISNKIHPWRNTGRRSKEKYSYEIIPSIFYKPSGILSGESISSILENKLIDVGIENPKILRISTIYTDGIISLVDRINKADIDNDLRIDALKDVDVLNEVLGDIFRGNNKSILNANENQYFFTSIAKDNIERDYNISIGLRNNKSYSEKVERDVLPNCQILISPIIGISPRGRIIYDLNKVIRAGLRNPPIRSSSPRLTLSIDQGLSNYNHNKKRISHSVGAISQVINQTNDDELNFDENQRFTFHYQINDIDNSDFLDIINGLRLIFLKNSKPRYIFNIS